MGKCSVRIRGSSKPPPPPPAAAASCLTLRSGRRVLPVVAASSSAEKCSPRKSGRPRRHLGSALRCGAAAEGAKKSACSSPRRRGEADAGGRVLLGARHRLFGDGQHDEEEEEVPPSRVADTGRVAAAVARGVHGRGDSFDRRPKALLMIDDRDDDAATVKMKAKRHENESHCRDDVVAAGQMTLPPAPPTEAEIEAFFAAAELAERRRFAEAYNYDVALDRPLEGRFEWAPVST